MANLMVKIFIAGDVLIVIHHPDKGKQVQSTLDNVKVI